MSDIIKNIKDKSYGIKCIFLRTKDQPIMKYLLLFLGIFFVNAQKIDLEVLNEHFNSTFYENQFVGFSLYDPVSNMKIYDFNGEKYFVPASNMKIFTLYTALKILDQEVPAFKYIVKNDTIFIKGTGDPTLLEPYFKQKETIEFLKNRKEKIALYLNDFDDDFFRPGWSWDDYSEEFSPERSAFPIYGNVVKFTSKQRSLNVYPSYFSNKVSFQKNNYHRDLRENKFYITNSRLVPFIVSDNLVSELLSKEINKKVSLINNFPIGETETFYSIPSDSLYKRMMLVSDNFLTEQTMLMASEEIYSKMNTEKMIDYMLKNYLFDFPQKPKIADASGLSRYNLITPQDFVYLLNLLYQEYPQKRILNLFPVGGVSGTVKNYYKSKTPYIYAKTGTMGGVHNLSGYLKTKSGKFLIFSYMNNNYIYKVAEIRGEMEKILSYIRDNY